MSKALSILKYSVLRSAKPNYLSPLGAFNFPEKSDIFLCDSNLHQRPECETNYSSLQIIPYLTLVDRHTGKIFVYIRGHASGEGRLTGKCSIGIGGHIEDEPSDTMSLLDIIADGALRELNEETGIEATDTLLAAIKQKLISSNFHLIYTEFDDVAKVHLGIHIMLTVDMNEISATEENIITKGMWLCHQEIADLVAMDKDFNLEHWSKIVLEEIL